MVRFVVAFFTGFTLILLKNVFDVFLPNRYILILFFIFVTICFFILRVVMTKHVSEKDKRTTNILFVGTDTNTESIIKESKKPSYKVVGLLLNAEAVIGQKKRGLKVAYF